MMTVGRGFRLRAMGDSLRFSDGEHEYVLFSKWGMMRSEHEPFAPHFARVSDAWEASNIVRTRIFFRDIDAEDVYALAVLSPRPFGLVNSWDGADKPLFDAARHFNRYRSVEELIFHEMNRWFEPRFERLGLFRMRIERKRPARVEETPPPVTAPRAGARQATAFFEVMLLSEEDEAPLSDVRLEVELPSGERRAVTTNGEGIARLDGLSSSFSSCAVHTAEIDGLTVDAALFPADASATRLPRMLLLHGRAPAAETRTGLVQLRAHEVQKNETIEGIAEKYGLSADVLLQFNFGTNDPEEVEGYLEDHVGWAAPQDREEGAPPVFGGKEVPGLLFIPGPIALHGLALGRTHRVHVSAVTRVVERVSSTVALDQLAGLATKRGKPFFTAWMASNFSRGETPIPVEAYHALYDDLEAGAFVHPPIRLVQPTARLQGDKKAYVASYDKVAGAIELSIDLVRDAALEEDSEAAWLVLGGLIEEFGHHLDHVLRNHYSSVGGDAEGDEGSRFGYLLLNLDWYGQTSAEIGTYEDAEGNTHPVVVDWSALDEKIEALFSEEHQARDGQDERREDFGPGMGRQWDPESWGHEAIEREMLGIFEEDELPLIYFGNWLRDNSQVLTPPLVGTEDSPEAGWLSPALLVAFVDYRASKYFGDDPRFEVTAERLGEYRYEEHIDNPFGLDGVSPQAWDIDGRRLMARHIATPSPAYRCSLDYMRGQLRAALRAGRGDEGYRLLGHALHALEDFFSHTNFCELVLRQQAEALGSPALPVVWTAPFDAAISTPRSPLSSTTVYPLVTGTFGRIDTAASLLYELAASLQGESICEDFEISGERLLRLFVLFLNEVLHPSRRILRSDGSSLEMFAEHWKREAESLLEFPPALRRGGFRASGGPGEVDPALRAAVLRWENLRRVQGFMVCTMAARLEELAREMKRMQTVTTGASGMPTHTQLAKDHDDHPLHDLAARMAAIAIREVGYAVRDAWMRDDDCTEGVLEIASSYFVHPLHIAAESPQEKLLALAESWSRSHLEHVTRACDRTWLDAHAARETAKREREARELMAREQARQWADGLVEGVSEAFGQMVEASSSGNAVHSGI